MLTLWGNFVQFLSSSICEQNCGENWVYELSLYQDNSKDLLKGYRNSQISLNTASIMQNCKSSILEESPRPSWEPTQKCFPRLSDLSTQSDESVIQGAWIQLKVGCSLPHGAGFKRIKNARIKVSGSLPPRLPGYYPWEGKVWNCENEAEIAVNNPKVWRYQSCRTSAEEKQRQWMELAKETGL